MTTNEQRQLGRAKNAILAFLERRISVPKIYIDAVWDGHSIDVLAIDRDGVGDVHAVLLFDRRYHADGTLDHIPEDDECLRLIKEFEQIEAQYKYIGAVGKGNGLGLNAKWKLLDRLLEASYAPDGIGRIGFLQIVIHGEEEPQVIVEIKPERFRAKISKLADDYIQQHEPDWQVRA
jgi:hypothetical protein